MNTRNFSKSHLLWLFFIAWGAAIFWIAPHPPMVDFPQHAAQISLLTDLISGKSLWSAQLQINLLTPYLIGYGLAALLSFVMPVVFAMKLLLSVSYVLFIAVCVAFRKRVDADPRLDWILVPTYFGFCYAWGMFTYLVAAPIGVLFILLADKYSTALTIRSGISLTIVGIVLLISHGMTFILGWGAGLLLLILNMPLRWREGTRLLPYIVLLIAGFIFYQNGKQLDATLIHQPSVFDYGSTIFMRIKEAFQFPFSSDIKIGSKRIFIPVTLAITFAPYLFGLRVNWRRPAAWVPFFCVCILFFALPRSADNTAFLYSRYSLFLLPAYVWMFKAKESTTKGLLPSTKINWHYFPKLTLIGSCILILGTTSINAWRFGQETLDLDAEISKLVSGQRALGLIFDANSQAAENTVVYLHYGAWYQAEKHGFTDFNFAWFTPQVVRYRPGYSPPVEIGFEWEPGSFDWSKHQGMSYRYFFVRGKHDAMQLFKEAPCQPKTIFSKEMWTVYENCIVSVSAAPS